MYTKAPVREPFFKNQTMKYFFVLLALCLLSACNHDKSKTEERSHDQHEHPSAEIQDLKLNNGKKWASDASTDRNVEELNNTLQQFESNSSPKMADYKELSLRLQENINTMVNECRMKGPDHDALHQWLEPIIHNTKELKQSIDEKTAAILVKNIRDRVNIYSQYFARS